MPQEPPPFRGDDRLLFGIILGVLAFWLFAQTTLTSRRPWPPTWGLGRRS